MEKRIVSGIVCILLLLGMLTLAFNIQPVKASGTIYIRADGSVDPDTAPISSADNITYTFTDNINDSIVVERDNIVVDGAGYTLQGTGAWDSKGIYLLGRSNVTTKNTTIKAFYYGMFIIRSSNNTISGNNLVMNEFGIRLSLYSYNNTLRNNSMTNNTYNFGVFSWTLSGFVHDIDDSNTVNDKPVYYWINKHDMTIPLDAGYAALINCTQITLQNLNVTNNEQGILLAYTTDSKITRNNITNNYDSIYLCSSSNNTISGNKITKNDHYSVLLLGSSNNTIIGNNITNNWLGIGLGSSSNNNTIYENNIIENDEFGISLGGSSSNIISRNNIKKWHLNGIELGASSNNTIIGNNITDNEDGITLKDSSNHNRIAGNNITNNCLGITLDGSSDNSISRNNITANSGDGISLEYSSNNSISGNNITANYGSGIWLESSRNSIVGNSITDNNNGIWIYWSSNNTISGNNITNNDCGVGLSSNNFIYHNNFIGNAKQVSPYGSANVWDDGYPSGGNYWSDYNGTDRYCGLWQNVTGSDGIGDTPYVINENTQDNYPLMHPVGFGDLNDDGVVNILDIFFFGKAFGSYPGHPRWNPNVDLDGNGIINILDGVIVAKNFGKTYL